MKPAAVSRSGSAVAFSWEHEPGVSKKSPVEATKVEARSETTTPAMAKEAPAADQTAHQHRLRVPPPPGAPAASPPGRSRPRRRGDDPFLAAYLACTEGGTGSNGGQRLLGRSGLGYGLWMRGFGLSCKSSCEAVEESMVRLARIPSKITRNE